MQPVKNQTFVPCVDVFGRPVPTRNQKIYNNPLTYYLPDEPVITVLIPDEWKTEDGAKKMGRPVFYKGQRFRYDWAWGSAVKRGQTLGLRSDVFAEKGILRFDEDAYRIARAYLPNATGALAGKVNVKLVKMGTVAQAGPWSVMVHDGYGFIKESLARRMDHRFQTIKMGTWKTSYTFLQWFEWTDELLDELWPSIEDGLYKLNNPAFHHYASEADLAGKTSFILALKEKSEEAMEKMETHPYFASTLAESWARKAYQLATAAGITMQGGVFVPVPGKEIILPNRENIEASDEYIITRYPIDGPGSIRVIEAGEDDGYINNIEVIQYTLTNEFQNSFKGCVGVLPDEYWPVEWEGYEIVLCTEDEKLNSSWRTEDDVTCAKETPREYHFKNAFFAALAWYEAGSAFGIPTHLAKGLNGDYDGDQGAVLPADRYPEMARQAKKLPQVANPKLPKTKTPTKPGKSRADVIVKSISNIVGFATNVLATVMVFPDKEFLATHILGKNSWEDLLHSLMYAIKVGTDLFKTSVDPKPVVKMLAHYTKTMRDAGIYAPWTGWRRDETAFYNEIPPVYDAPEEVDEWGKRTGVSTAMQGTIAEIARIVLPQIVLPPVSSITPLAAFRDYAMQPASEEYHKAAKSLQSWYALRVQSTNLLSVKDYQTLVTDWKEEIESTIKKHNLDRWLLANALWYVTHNGQRHGEQGLKKKASAVFVGMPEEALRIAMEQPGKKVLLTATTRHQVKLVGLQYQIPDPRAITGRVLHLRVQTFTQVKNSHRIVRQALCSDFPLPGQVPPKDPQYPDGQVALLPLDAHLEDGWYIGQIRPVQGVKSVYYVADLQPIPEGVAQNA